MRNAEGEGPAASTIVATPPEPEGKILLSSSICLRGYFKSLVMLDLTSKYLPLF